MPTQDSDLRACLGKRKSHGSSKVSTTSRDNGCSILYIEQRLRIESLLRHISSSRCCSSKRVLFHNRSFVSMILQSDGRQLRSPSSLTLFNDVERMIYCSGFAKHCARAAE